MFRRWVGEDIHAELLNDIMSEELTLLVIENNDGTVIGGIQWGEEETDPRYRHAGLDLYIHPAYHGNGYGTDAIATLVDCLLNTVGHHRSSSTPPPTTPQQSPATQRSASVPAAQCDATNKPPMVHGTTASSWTPRRRLHQTRTVTTPDEPGQPLTAP